MASLKLLVPFIMALVPMEFQLVSSTLINHTSNQYGITYVKAERLTYDWTIRNFSLLPEENGEYIVSPIFGNENDDAQWQLHLYPQGEDKDFVGYTSVYLHLHSQEAEVIKKKVHFTILMLHSNITYVNKTMDHTYKELQGYGEPDFERRSVFLDLAHSDDTFIIRAEIDMHLNTVTESFTITDPLEQELFRELEKGRLNENLATLLKDDKYADVTVVVSNEKFLVHNAILASRSPVFAEQFQHEGYASHRWRKEMRIEDMNPVEVKAMLEFIYTDEVTNLETLAVGLLKAADKYKLPRLRTMCEIALYRRVDVDNAIDLYVLTDLYQSNRLKEHVMKFITNHLGAVMESGGYKKMIKDHTAISIELLNAVVQPCLKSGNEVSKVEGHETIDKLTTDQAEDSNYQ